MLDHATGHFAGGGLGVSVFFVLSGFLITTLLVDERDRTGTLNLRLFYARRMLRLYPALLVMLVLTVGFGGGFKAALAAGTYTMNIYASVGGGTGAYGHTWSLALEEQFYLVWPLLIGAFLTRIRIGTALLCVLALSSAIACYVGTDVLIVHGTAPAGLVFNPVWQAHGLIIGCALALFLIDRPRRAALDGRSNVILVGVGGIVALAIAASLTVSAHLAAWWNLGGELFAAIVIFAMVQPGPSGLGLRLFESRVSTWAGRRSYAIYLWHFPIIYLLLAHGVLLHVAGPIGVISALILAELSYRIVERPFLKLKDRLHPRGRRPVATVLSTGDVLPSAVIASGTSEP